jgi:hypothetical protein
MSDAQEPDRPTRAEEDDDESSSIFGSEIGDDWGEAFEADDFAFSPDEDVSSEFFLEEDVEDDAASQKTAIPSTPEEEGGATHVEKAGVFKVFTALLYRAQLSVNRGRVHFLSLPAFYKIALLTVLSLVVLFSLYYFQKESAPGPPAQQAPEQTTVAPVQSPEKIAELDTLAAAKAPEEKIRTKWHFPAFLISTSDEMKGDNIFFVEVDITLNLLLNEGEKVPADKAVFLREIIYQFFNNRPLYELRRYSLARGEMNRKLRSWIEKEWPEGEIASIVFNRYQVL